MLLHGEKLGKHRDGGHLHGSLILELCSVLTIKLLPKKFAANRFSLMLFNNKINTDSKNTVIHQLFNVDTYNTMVKHTFYLIADMCMKF